MSINPTDEDQTYRDVSGGNPQLTRRQEQDDSEPCLECGLERSMCICGIGDDDLDSADFPCNDDDSWDWTDEELDMLAGRYEEGIPDNGE